MKAALTAIRAGFVVLLSFAGSSAAADNPPDSSPYLVDTYDSKRSADDDLKTAVDRARTSGKRILLQVGGDWCGWCHLMSKYFKENDNVAKALAKDYLIVKVNYSDQNENKEFLGQYPEIPGYPHLFVLDTNGKLLHSQGTAVLEEGKGYNETKVLAFLEKWAPKK